MAHKVAYPIWLFSHSQIMHVLIQIGFVFMLIRVHLNRPSCFSISVIFGEKKGKDFAEKLDFITPQSKYVYLKYAVV